MISSLQVEGFRGFERFEMGGLGRVNLLVGTNNSGKTSVLEAIHLLFSAGDPGALWQMLWRRGERLPLSPLTVGERSPIELDVAHLFYGHEAQTGTAIRVSANNQTSERFIRYSIAEAAAWKLHDTFGEGEGPLAPRLALEIEGNPKPSVELIPLTRAGGMYASALDLAARRGRLRSNGPSPSYFITAESSTRDELVSMWNRVSLTPSEGLVLQALQFLDPDVERIASQSTSGPYYSPQTRGGFIIKRKGWEQPVPIGSMGDGMWRMLATAIAITQCKGGVLLVDEIDTGLHYSVMSRMWKLIFNAARELDVQVFATTHSYDCVYSLAQICSGRNEAGNSVTVQRIDPGRVRAVPYDEDEITTAANREIEVR